MPFAAAAATPRPFFPHRHLLGIEGLSPRDIIALLDLSEEAIEVSRQVEKKRTTLRGRTQINLFFEASTRTQSSFEIAGKRLGADVMNMSVATSQREERRDADRHRDDAERDAARRHRRAPPSGRRGASARPQGRLRGRQRRRRRARAPDPGAARRADHPPQQGPDRGARQSRSAATSCIRASRGRTFCCSQTLGAQVRVAGALDADAGGHRAHGRRGLPRLARRRSTAPTS